MYHHADLGPMGGMERGAQGLEPLSATRHQHHREPAADQLACKVQLRSYFDRLLPRNRFTAFK